MSARIRVIKHLNAYFIHIIGCQIPLDQPINSHERMFADSGGMSWYFVSRTSGKDHLDYTQQEQIDDWRIKKVGSTYTMTALLKNKEDWVLIRDEHDISGEYEISFATMEGVERNSKALPFVG